MDITTILQNRKNIVKRRTTGQLENKYFEVDKLLDETSDLVNDTFRSWYCKMYHKLGRERVLVLASQARADGKDSAKLFSHLLRKA